MIEPLKDLSKMNDSEKLVAMESFMRQLCEHLNWQFENISFENFSEEVKGAMGK